MRISWHLSMTKQTPPPIQEVLMKIQKEANSPQAVLNFLLIYKLVGYLNFKLIDCFNHDGNLSEDSVVLLKRYKEMHFQFYKTFTTSAIIGAFKKEPSLAPVSNIDLPTFKVELQEPWKGRKVFEWRDINSDVVNLPDDLIITGVEEGNVVLTYAVLPCFVASVVEQLTNETILEQLAAVGINIELTEYLIALGKQETESINSKIKHSKLLTNFLLTSTRENNYPFLTDEVSLNDDRKVCV